MTPAHDVVSAEYDQHKAEVLRTVRAKLSAVGVRNVDSDLEASYNEAWHALYMAMADGEDVENRVGYLVTVTHRRALNELRALKVSRRIDVDSVEDIGIELDIDSQLDAEIQIRQIREGFQNKLSKRELDAATLCHLYGYSRPEAAKALGVRPKRMEKIMDKASGKIRSVVDTVRAGEHCDSMSSSIRAFALGVLDPEGEKYQMAAEHLKHCSACRREVWVERGLAAIGPPLPVAFVLLAGGATAGGGAGAVLLGEGDKAGSAGSSGSAGGGGVGSGAAAQTPVVAGVVGVVAAVAVAVGLVTGVIGGGSDDSPTANDSSTVAAGGGSGSQQAAAAAAAAKAQAAKAAAAKKAAQKKARAAKKRRQARAAAEAAAVAAAELAAAEAAAAAVVAEPAPVPEPTYVPAPPPVEKPKPQEKPKRDQESSKPTKDAGEEFGLR